MQTRDWIVILVAVFTLASSWAQFWVKERIFSKPDSLTDGALAALKSKGGVTIIALTGIASAVCIWLLASEVLSDEPVTRISVFSISALTVLALLNILLVHSVFTLRRLATLREDLRRSRIETMARISLMS